MPQLKYINIIINAIKLFKCFLYSARYQNTIPLVIQNLACFLQHLLKKEEVSS